MRQAAASGKGSRGQRHRMLSHWIVVLATYSVEITALCLPKQDHWSYSPRLVLGQISGRGAAMTGSTVIDRYNKTSATRGRSPGQPGRENATPKEQQRADGPGRGGPLERVTVNLVSRASQALRVVVKLTGDSRTDSINRAIQLYAYVLGANSNGGGVYVREREGSELQRVRMF